MGLSQLVGKRWLRSIFVNTLDSTFKEKGSIPFVAKMIQTKKKLIYHLNKFKNIVNIYFTPKNEMWCVLSTGKKKCILKKMSNSVELDNFLKDKSIISYEESKVININISKNSILMKYSKEIRVFNMEGLNFLQKKVSDNSVNLIITDPPYIISKNSGFEKLLKQKKKLTNKMDKKYAFQSVFDWDLEFNLNQLESFIEQFFLKLKTGGTLIIFFDLWKITILKSMLLKNNFKQIRFIEWIKSNPVPINCKINYLSNCREIALVAVKGKNPCFNSYYDKGIYEFPIEQKNRTHPNQKNLKLFESLILKHSNRGDLVLDCFLGSGTTAFACKKLNRRFIGCEVKEKFLKWVK